MKRIGISIIAISLTILAFGTDAFSQDVPIRANSIYRSGSFPRASCSGWDGTITELTGVNSSNARMRGVITREDFQEFCERMKGEDEKDTVKKCVEDLVAEHRGRTLNPLDLMSTADCQRGVMRDTNEMAYQLVGTSRPPVITLVWKHIRTGKVLEGTCASGGLLLTEQFKLMCPTLVNRLIQQAKALSYDKHIDNAYISDFWRADEKGIFDIKAKRLAIAAKAPTPMMLQDMEGQFSVGRKVTEHEYKTERPLKFDIEFARQKVNFFVISVSTLDAKRQSIEEMSILSSNIPDRSGIRVGDFLNKKPGYNWKKLCRFSEGMLTCKADYSSKVWYDLSENAIEDSGATVESVLSRNPVRRIVIPVF